MKITARVFLSDGTEYVIATKPVDTVKFEAGTKMKVTDGIGGTGVFKLIHTAALREGRTSAGFEEWIASVDDIDANESDPTSPQPEASGT